MIGLVATGGSAAWGVLAGEAMAGFLPARVAAAGIAWSADGAVGIVALGGAAGSVAALAPAPVAGITLKARLCIICISRRTLAV